MALIAKRVGVSKMTVSRALAKSDLVIPETRKKVLQVAERLGYVPNATVSSFHSGRSSIVAAIIPEIKGSFFPDLMAGLCDAFADSRFQVLIGNTTFDEAKEEAIVEAALRRRPEAVILTGETHTPRTRRLLKAAKIPVIETWDIPKSPIDQVVGVSDVDASRAMTHHLANLGYRRIGFVMSGKAGHSRMAKRHAGYLKGLEELEVREQRVVAHGGLPMSMQDGADALMLMLSKWPEADAIFFASDAAAFGALMECHRRGLRVPQDVAIAGFGNFEVSKSSHPRLTTVSVDAYKLGLSAGNLILQERAAMRQRGQHRPQSIIIDFEICQREST